MDLWSAISKKRSAHFTKSCKEGIMDATVKNGLAVTGTDAQKKQDNVNGDVQNFLKGLGRIVK